MISIVSAASTRPRVRPVSTLRARGLTRFLALALGLAACNSDSPTSTPGPETRTVATWIASVDNGIDTGQTQPGALPASAGGPGVRINAPGTASRGHSIGLTLTPVAPVTTTGSLLIAVEGVDGYIRVPDSTAALRIWFATEAPLGDVVLVFVLTDASQVPGPATRVRFIVMDSGSDVVVPITGNWSITAGSIQSATTTVVLTTSLLTLRDLGSGRFDSASTAAVEHRTTNGVSFPPTPTRITVRNGVVSSDGRVAFDVINESSPLFVVRAEGVVGTTSVAGTTATGVGTSVFYLGR